MKGIKVASLHWFMSYGDFAEWMDFAYWWGFSNGEPAINGATPSSLNIGVVHKYILDLRVYITVLHRGGCGHTQ